MQFAQTSDLAADKTEFEAACQAAGSLHSGRSVLVTRMNSRSLVLKNLIALRCGPTLSGHRRMIHHSEPMDWQFLIVIASTNNAPSPGLPDYTVDHA